MKTLIPVALIGLALTPPSMAQTSDACYCLMDEEDTVWFDCRAVQRLTHTDHYCADQGGQTLIPNADRLTSIAAGTGVCNPCRLHAGGPDGPHGMRGLESQTTDQ